MNNNDLQVNDLVESLKNIIADQAYKIAYREAMIAAYERQIAELNDILTNRDDRVQGVEVTDDVR